MAQDIEIKIKAAIESAEAANSIQELEDAIKELESVAAQVDLGSQKYSSLSDSLEQTSNKLEQTKTSFESAERKIQAFQGGIDVLGGSVASLVGGLAVLGVENEYITNLEQGAVGALAFASGIKQFADGAVALGRNLNIASVAQRAFNVVANLNPYVLGATALVAAGAAIFSIAKSLSSVETETRNVNIAYTNLVPNLESAKTAYDNLKTSIDAVFASEQQNAISSATSGIQKNIDANLSGLTELQSALDTVIERRNTQIRGAAKFNEQFTSQYLQNLSLAELERDKAIAEGRKKGDEARAIDFEIQRRQLQQQVTQTKNIIEEGERAKQKVVNDINAENAAKRQEEFIATQQQIGIEQAKIIEATTIQNEALLNRTIILPQLNQQVLDAVRDITGLSTEQADAITNSTDLIEAGLERFGENAASTFDFVNDLNTLFTKGDEARAKRAFQIQKAANLANAITTTAVSVNKAFASQIIPGDPTSLPRAIGAGVLAGIKGAAQIATILRTKFESTAAPITTAGGGGNLGGVGGGPTTTPTFTPAQFFGLGQQTATTGGPTPQDTRVFVVESDITNVQNRVSVIESRSTIG